MPDINVVNGSDTTYQNSGLAQGVGTTFQINADFFTVTLNDDDNVFDGDQNTNETPDDPNQTIDMGSGPVAAFYDYSFQASFGGQTFTFAVIDVDLNNDGDVGNGTLAGADAGEQLVYLAVIGPVPVIPPGGATFTVTQAITDNTDQPFPDFICFAAGTLIQTRNGLVPVESLTPETLVQTMDNGFQPLIWSARRRVPAIGQNAPVHIAKGSLGNIRPLVVSSQHRILVNNWRSELYSQSKELFIPAQHLIGHPGITRDTSAEVDYVHLLFENHEVIFAEGAATESLHPHKAVHGEMGLRSQREILAIFPELRKDPDAYGPTARPIAHAHEAGLVA